MDNKLLIIFMRTLFSFLSRKSPKRNYHSLANTLPADFEKEFLLHVYCYKLSLRFFQSNDLWKQRQILRRKITMTFERQSQDLKCVNLYSWQNRPLVWQGQNSANSSKTYTHCQQKLKVETKIKPGVESEFDFKIEPQVKLKIKLKVEPDVELEVKSDINLKVEPAIKLKVQSEF